MKIHTVEQGGMEWLALRASCPTASEFDKILTPAKLEISKSLPAYVALKLAEKWLGHPLQEFAGTGMMDQGSVRQEDARPWYSAYFDVELDAPGFITTDDNTAGCSPDAMIRGRKRGIELKCCEANKHVEYLLAGTLPREHMIQVQGCMLVCDYDEWDFVSFHKELPKFVLTVNRDKKICDALTEGLQQYWNLFNEGWAKLIAANGGEEPVRRPVTMRTEDDVTTATLDGVAEDALDAFMRSPAMNG